MHIKIGDTLYTHPPGRPGHLTMGRVITGDTRLSWLVGDPKFSRHKVLKKSLRENIPRYGHRQWYTEAGVNAAGFVDKHRFRIVSALSVEGDVSKLKKIAEILGVEL